MNFKPLLVILLTLTCILFPTAQQKPVLYLIGDSTVASASTTNPIQGWGGKLAQFFDTSKIEIQNRAVSGISSRTYQTGIVHDPGMLKNGMWKGIMNTLKPGDFVIMQFGHNDESPVADTLRMRGSLKGTGNDSVLVLNHFTKQQEVVYSYGHYLRKLVADIKSKGATAIICSPIPKNKWNNGDKVIRNEKDYGLWAKETAEQSGAAYIDLNKGIADEYDKEGKAKVAASFFVPDGIHTTSAGATQNAAFVAHAIKKLRACPLKSFLNI
ncbi:rhamnogalacturonan acetylesterase [Pedobacter sp. AW31-3R]|uniref:rhamnogalacturonan acetylesterase n=1 Tax=Pedobacter sp. AW31-3R TaxID=3445781 RepID=UPI003F9EEC34